MQTHSISTHKIFDESKVIHHLKHYLPAQAPLKDFVHHNLLHALQNKHFHDANFIATKIFGYKTYLNIEEYRQLFQQGYISEFIIEKVIEKRKGKNSITEWKFRMLYDNIEFYFNGKLGRIMHLWKDYYHINISKYVQPILFRVISNYLDQGIALLKFPYQESLSFLENIADIEQKSFESYFFNKKGRARKWLVSNNVPDIKKLLDILVENEEWYEDYLFNMCFEHPGWSGLVSVVEEHPDTLIHRRNISLKEWIQFELLLQIDYLDNKFNSEQWQPLGKVVKFPDTHLFDVPAIDERFEIAQLWQESLEWSYYEQVIKAIHEKNSTSLQSPKTLKFQSIHCIDDREESFRRYLEYLESDCETFGTAGFFNMDLYYLPCHSEHPMKIAPANAQPQNILIEQYTSQSDEDDINLHHHSHSLLKGWFYSQTVGFWSALKLITHIFKPHDNPMVISAIKHSEINSNIQFESNEKTFQNFKIGLSDEEAANKLEVLLKSIGLVQHFAPVVYILGHGAGSTNNPYYAAYDCGACSGKPGSVNARVAAYFLNKRSIRNILNQKGISIPDNTVFIAALHNTTSDKIYFFDIDHLNDEAKKLHQQNISVFEKALLLNARERARRFETIDKTGKSDEYIHQKIQEREWALFIPRPEYNHATNAVCVVGRRTLTKNVFLDRRAFLNSYDYSIDKDGKLLTGLLKALTNVCGGINLEYYYSRTDNEKLGAGSKLPHNVFGLIGVANGSDGDLRYGLPRQMIEIHQPLRLLMLIEQYPDIILSVIHHHIDIKEWFENGWIHLIALHPENNQMFIYHQDGFEPFQLSDKISIQKISFEHLCSLFDENSNDLPVFILK